MTDTKIEWALRGMIVGIVIAGAMSISIIFLI